jgi:hypothetical protein
MNLDGDEIDVRQPIIRSQYVSVGAYQGSPFGGITLGGGVTLNKET